MKRITTAVLTALLLALPEVYAKEAPKPGPPKPGPVLVTQQFTAVSFEETGRGNLIMHFEDANGTKGRVDAKHLMGCWRLSYGADMAEYLVSCDHTKAYLLSEDTDYRAVWSWLDGTSVHGVSGGRVFSGGKLPLVRAVLDGGQDKGPGVWQFYRDPKSNQYAQHWPVFEMDYCLKSAQAELLHEGFFDRYEVAIYWWRQRAEFSGLGAEITTRLVRLENLTREVNLLLHKKGLSDFLRGGHFYALNFKNTPVVKCIIDARAFGYDGPDKKFLGMMDENIRELEKSLDFLSRLE
ncbi:MAG: hypothetical protein A2583_15605 [Bdellovibrionales bacterium RIFOXYD1_FULL_53_11]|nr:MAG: hypothetical protein A2583_15605 [Bdellovibrionales bacterium RIFOXYD1_FULL_53_11]